MKCPKCSYIGFETTDRCRNCGYEFALADEAIPEADLPIKAAEEPGPFADLTFRAGPGGDGGGRSPGRALDLDRVIGAPEPKTESTTPAADLPLFAGSGGQPRSTPTHADHAGRHPPPAVVSAAAAASRRPLGVRRPGVDPVRPRPRPREESRVQTATMDLPLPPFAQAASEPGPSESPGSESPIDTGAAPATARLAAGAIDLALIGGLDLATLYLTLRLVGLGTGDWHALPWLPLAAYFLILNGGYLALFTAAGGQTIGKMATRLRVVGADSGPVSLGAASVRALGSIASTLCLGVGLWPALADEDGRALYDRLAQTRVVRMGS